MSMTAKQWAEWDHTAAYLQALQYNANMCSHHASEMMDILTMMKERPVFVTLSEDAINSLGKQIDLLQASFQSAKTSYQKLPQTA